MRRIVLILVLFLLGFGCLEEKSFPAVNGQVSNLQSVDIDHDGIPDYEIYDFAPTSSQGGIKLQRQITVSTKTTAKYFQVNDKITDIELVMADQNLADFTASRLQADSACSQAIGLSNVVCSDVVTCSKLCSSVSLKCKKISGIYDEALAGSMISYVKDNNQLRSMILDGRKMLVDLSEGSDNERELFLDKTRQMVEKVANINANPIYTHNDLGLCIHSDFDISSVVAAAKQVGNYTTEKSSYHYRMILSAKPTIVNGESDVAGISIIDSLPSSIAKADEISSIQSISDSAGSGNILVSWNSPKPSKDGYMFTYEFDSDQPPEVVVPAIKNPELKVKKVNLIALAPTNFIFGAFNGVLKNYYLALGIAVGLTIAALMFIYNIIVFAFTMVSERAAGMNFTIGFRKAFGKTDVKWKSDMIIAAIFLATGYYVCTIVAIQPSTPPQLLESFDFLLKSEMGLVGIGLVLIGVVLTYFAIENITKITILERAYGMAIRAEKDMFLAKAGALKDMIAELESLVEEYTKDDFDVSKEYDILNMTKSDRVDNLAKDMNTRSKTLIEENLARIEHGISSLKERKKLADNNWPKWKENIAKLIGEQNEVYTSSLITIPASLRAWALGRYAKEVGTEGIVFERDAIKKKKVSPDQLVREMVECNLIKGAVVMKQDKIVLSEFAEGSSTVMSALTLKLTSYLSSLAKNLGQHPPQSFVVVGDKYVVVIMKNRTFDSVLFLSKDKFKEAIEQWKAKTKIFESN